MSKANVKIVEEYIEQVINRRQFERLTEFCTEDCVLHAPPYVGLGVNFDDTSGEKLILTDVAPNSPADGRLQLGDELVRAQDGDLIVENFEELREGLWAQGLVDVELILTVRRNGSLIAIPLRRARINAFDLKASEIFNAANLYWKKYWPDIKMEVKEIFGGGDKVACYAINTGTNQEYGRSAVWDEFDIFKLKDGRITEVWGTENIYSQFKQLGYQITKPVHEPA